MGCLFCPLSRTTDPAAARATFVAPDTVRVEYEASTDGDPLTFDTSFALNQPSAKIPLKIYVVLETCSNTLRMQRPENNQGLEKM